MPDCTESNGVGDVGNGRGRQNEKDGGFSSANPEYPRSWWNVAWSGDVALSKAMPLRVLEQDMVLWRKANGELICQSAHCPHLGAHLGYGGEVQGDSIKCPFHGFRFDQSGHFVGRPGPSSDRAPNLCLKKYRVVERYGAVFLWNGADVPDHDVPDVFNALDESDDAVTFCHSRWYVPFPAKWFAENSCDAMHFAVAHDGAEWGSTTVVSQDGPMLELRNEMHGGPKYLSWDYIRPRYQRGELSTLLTPLTAGVTTKAWAATVHVLQLDGVAGTLGKNILCWTPVDDDSHYVMIITMIPRVRVPFLGRQLERLMKIGVALGMWTSLKQDAGIMMNREEPPNPGYTSSERGLIQFRRLWDSRIEASARGQLAGDGARSNGLRAGIRMKDRKIRDAKEVSA